MHQTQLDILPPRNLVALLHETFVIYGAHLWHFLALVAIIQIPLGLLLMVYMLFDRSALQFTINLIVSSLGTVIVYGAASTAVGQHYVRGNISISDCYARATWRLVSLIWLAAILAVGMLVLVSPLLLENASSTRALLLIPMIVSLVLLIWWFTSIPAVVTEGTRATQALRRTYGLMSGSKWRIAGIFFILFLVALGLSILVNIPFALLTGLSGTGLASTTSMAIQGIGSIFVETIVLPVLFIAGTLLYYDLRVRKEQYNVSELSEEMGISRVISRA